MAWAQGFFRLVERCMEPHQPATTPQSLRSRTIVIRRAHQAGDRRAQFSGETTLVHTPLGAGLNRSREEDGWVVLAHDYDSGGRHFRAKKAGDLQSTQARHADI